MIVGIDPGVTTAVAILDINGNLLDLHSGRDMKKSEVIKHICKFGDPIIVSSDVDVVPKSVEKIAKKLGCALYSPGIPMSFSEKKRLTKNCYEVVKNHHEVGALSAGIKAWKHYQPLISKVDDKLKKSDRQEIFADIISKMIKNRRSIQWAIRETVGK